jgi:hypothetical protein
LPFQPFHCEFLPCIGDLFRRPSRRSLLDWQSFLKRWRIARGIVDGCLRYQRPDGLFHDVVDQPATFVETNLAQMLSFTVYEGVAAGWLLTTYRAHGDGMCTASRLMLDGGGFVQGACGAPNFNRPGVSTEAQAFRIMMEASAGKFPSYGKPLLDAVRSLRMSSG